MIYEVNNLPIPQKNRRPVSVARPSPVIDNLRGGVIFSANRPLAII